MNAIKANEYIQAGLEANGFETVSQWLRHLAEEYGVPLTEVGHLAMLLGPSELFDGLVSSVQDRADEIGEGL